MCKRILQVLSLELIIIIASVFVMSQMGTRIIETMLVDNYTFRSREINIQDAKKHITYSDSSTAASMVLKAIPPSQISKIGCLISEKSSQDEKMAVLKSIGSEQDDFSGAQVSELLLKLSLK